MTTDLRSLNAAVQAAPGANAAVKAWIAGATAILEPTPPPVTTPPASGQGTAGAEIGLYSLGNGPQGFTHTSDGTYSLVIGPWPSKSFLATLSVPTMVYTVVAGTPGATDPPYTLLDPSNVLAYVQAVKNYVAGTPCGVFLDNVLLEIPTLTSAIQAVGTSLRAAGIPFGINLGSYVAGDSPDADDGQLWIDRVGQVGPYCTYCMLENWQQFSGGPNIGKPRTDDNGGYWSSWQKCPAAAQAAGTTIVAVTYGGEPNLTYGRASLLLAPGVGRAVFATGADTNRDPWDPTWTVQPPHPVVNPDGTASL